MKSGASLPDVTADEIWLDNDDWGIVAQYSTQYSFTIILKKPLPIPLGTVPLSVPTDEPVHIRTHASWVRVQTGRG